MKILFCSYNEKWHANILQKVSDELDADEVVSISKIDHQIKVKNNNYHWIDNAIFVRHKSDSFEIEELPAIDAELIEKMYSYESLYYPMLDRYEVDNFIQLPYQKRNQYYKNDLQALLHIIQKYQIDVCVFGDVPHIGYDYILYGLCKCMNIVIAIEYMGVLIPRKSATIYFMEDLFNPIPDLSRIQYEKEKFLDKEKLSLRMQSYIDQYNREKSEITSFITISSFVKVNKYIEILQLIIRRVKERQFFLAIRRKYHRYWAGKKVNRYLKRVSERKITDKYIYYPLHYQPEGTSLPMGGEYYDQLLVIKMISQHLPKDVMLYVKPHPNRSLYADKDYYQKIISLKNVKLISKDVNTYDLIDNALAVVSLTGTAILEALVRKKHVLMFGYYIWQYAPGVYHCKTEKDCIKALAEVCTNKDDKTNELIFFLNELDKHLVDGVITENFLTLYEIDLEQNVNNISQECVNFIKKKIVRNTRPEK